MTKQYEVTANGWAWLPPYRDQMPIVHEATGKIHGHIKKYELENKPHKFNQDVWCYGPWRARRSKATGCKIKARTIKRKFQDFVVVFFQKEMMVVRYSELATFMEKLPPLTTPNSIPDPITAPIENG